jgi:hypothetical protein
VTGAGRARCSADVTEVSALLGRVLLPGAEYRPALPAPAALAIAVAALNAEDLARVEHIGRRARLALRPGMGNGREQ